MNTVLKRLFFVFLIWLPFSSHAQADTTKILFVGNSFTYFWNLPQLVQAMAETRNMLIRTSQSTVGGSNLEQHWKEEKGTMTRKLLEEKQWDYVVMNNHSLSPIETPESFMEYGEKFAELVNSKGAIPVFFMTWSYESNPLMQPQITEMYEKLAAKTSAQLVPVGLVWDRVRKERSHLDLYHDDKHPSPEGTYLIALIFFRHFTDESVKGLPERLRSRDQFGEKLYLSILHKKEAKLFQQSVDDFYSKKGKSE
jgi:hypothetical protein